MLPRALALWFAILVLAIANGMLREALLVPALGPVTGLAASGVVLSLAIVAVAIAGVRWLKPSGAPGCWRVGALWLALTLAFEFSFGRLVQHKSWHELLQAYTFSDGNLWPIVLLATLLAPRLAAAIRRVRRTAPATQGPAA